MNLRIGIDLDNTILNTPLIINDLYKEDTGVDLGIKEDCGWDFSPYVDKDLHPYVLKYFEDERFYDYVHTIYGAVESIRKLSEDNEVWVVTKHSNGIRRKLTEKWIKDTFGDKVGVFFTYTFDKSSFGECDIFIDDKPECLSYMNNKCLFSVMFGDYEWNMGYIPKKILFRRMKNWKDIFTIVDELILFKQQIEELKSGSLKKDLINLYNSDNIQL